MSNIVALLFEDIQGAENMYENVLTWQEQGLIKVLDAVIATRGVGSSIEVKQKNKKTGKYAASGGGIGLIAGLILGGPIGGLAVGATAGAISGHMKQQKLERHFVDDVVEGIRPETSILFLMTDEGDVEGLEAELRPHHAKVLSTTLSAEQEANLRNLLAREE